MENKDLLFMLEGGEQFIKGIYKACEDKIYFLSADEETEYENAPCVVLTFDVGSWSEFFHIYFDNMLQADKFRDSFSDEKKPF